MYLRFRFYTGINAPETNVPIHPHRWRAVVAAVFPKRRYNGFRTLASRSITHVKSKSPLESLSRCLPALLIIQLLFQELLLHLLLAHGPGTDAGDNHMGARAG